MPNKNDKSLEPITISVITSIVLAIIGIIVIIHSTIVYKDSLNYVKLATSQDTSLKSKITSLPNYTIVKEGYSQALLYFTLAFGVILLAVLLPRLTTFSITPTGINFTLKDLQEQVRGIAVVSNDLQEKLADQGGIKFLDKMKMKEMNLNIDEKQKIIKAALTHPNDLQKGRWGGTSESNGRRLSAKVIKTVLPGLYEVNLKVAGTDNNPLSGFVKFHLHDTFKNPDPVIAVLNGEANLSLKKVWGAFTVGAEADNGVTHLELDLSELDGVSEEFKEN